MKILLLGSSGLLGSTLAPFLESCGHEVITHSRGSNTHYKVDLSDWDETHKFLDQIQSEVIINLVGLTDVDVCESDPNLAYMTNVRTVENITDWLRQGGTPSHFIQISTDQVYDGANLNKERQVVLRNYYAFSKFAGELAAASVPSTILRTNLFGRSKCTRRSSLSDWLYKALSSGDPIQVIDDIMFSPLSMVTLSEMIERATQEKPTGVFNLGSHKGMSKADFAYAFADEWDLPTASMARASIEDVTFLKSHRPTEMRMNCSKFEKIIGVSLPTLKSEIERAASEYD